MYPVCSNILYRRHIEKNVQVHYRKHFTHEDWGDFSPLWKQFVNSNTEDEYIERFKKMRASMNETIIQYIEDNWLPLKHKFISIYINKVPHYSNFHTTRVEGAHRHIKKELNHRMGELSNVVASIYKRLNSETHERAFKATKNTFKKINNLHSCFEPLQGIENQLI